ncbi:cytochrome c [Alkalimonas sp. NCh-2]|uniref:c-type cytochrome n=1 Tax=Alkalimonas sp. NCh-2 TaxID=3144846 RepID=UPI0031F69503
MRRTGFGHLAGLLLLIGFSSFAAQATGDSAAGLQKAAVCSACHGADGNSPVPTMYPTLAGQSVTELTQALIDYRAGSRQGGMAAMMTAMAEGLSDTDIADLAAFFSQQQRN